AAAQGQTPRSGREVLEAMRTAYNGKWYHTLTFTQKTTFRNQDGTERVQTWREALRHTGATGTWLRIDIGDLKDGNGVIYTADSSWRIRGGKVAAANADGNPFLPLIEGVYVQPVDRTIRELAQTKVDLSKVYQTKSQGRDVWVVGASSAADTTSAQFWIDAERKVVTRMLLTLAANRPPYDIQLGGYERVGNGWLATKIVMLVGGVPQQTEEYSDWKIDVPLDAALFDPAQWTTVKHWSTKP
ncbi:MAG TPA: hypothetical protein VIP11_09350, partial [Gemmatimonadaceae bacterium]